MLTCILKLYSKDVEMVEAISLGARKSYVLIAK